MSTRTPDPDRTQNDRPVKPDPEELEEDIDESVEESFPASDPPAHRSIHKPDAARKTCES